MGEVRDSSAEYEEAVSVIHDMMVDNTTIGFSRRVLLPHRMPRGLTRRHRNRVIGPVRVI
jgi:hypothetical protein